MKRISRKDKSKELWLKTQKNQIDIAKNREDKLQKTQNISKKLIK